MILCEVHEGGGRFIWMKDKTWSIVPDDVCRGKIKIALDNCIRTALQHFVATNVNQHDDRTTESGTTNEISTKPNNRPISNEPSRLNHNNFGNSFDLVNTSADQCFTNETVQDYHPNTSVHQIEYTNTNAGATQLIPIVSPINTTYFEPSMDEYNSELYNDSPIPMHIQEEAMTNILLPTLLPVASQPLLYCRLFDPVTKKYINQWETTCWRPDISASTTAIPLPLELGGMMTIYPNLIDINERDTITREILQYRHSSDDSNNGKNKTRSRKQNDESPLSLFRQYRIQGCDEPRLNCLLHTNATVAPAVLDDTKRGSSSQPGYRYGSITMKGHSYENLPKTHQFTKRMELLYNDSSTQNDPTVKTSALQIGNNNSTKDDAVFNIGANVVLYRDAHDSMGYHADNDQEETFILTAIMSQKQVRDIIIKPKPCMSTTGNDVLVLHYKLRLNEGDAYSMDGTCVCSYCFLLSPHTSANTMFDCTHLL